MAIAGGQEDGEPMMDLNTTPLIDVMLVLLIMFIITIPPQTHAVKVNLPIPDPNRPQDVIDRIKNRLYIDPASQLFWNGQPINDAILVRVFWTQTTHDGLPSRSWSSSRTAPRPIRPSIRSWS